jgi:hypothetical protein
MNNLILLKHRIFYIVVLFALLFSFGCKEKKEINKNNIDVIKSFLSDCLNNPNLSKDENERIRITLMKYDNKELSSQPVLLRSYMVKPEGYEWKYLALTIVDPNEDIIGFGIREDCNELNCCWNTIEESYPVYIHCLTFNKVAIVMIPFHIRDNCQK